MMARAVPRIAFHAPMKSPDSPVPSGDRTMARNLLAALAAAGFAPGLATPFTCREPHGDRAAQEALIARGRAEADRLIARWTGAPHERPDLWFTYHCYYKAPDLVGPAVAGALRIPYVVAEGSRAAKRADGPWARFHAASEAALDRADILFAMTGKDRPALEAAAPAGQRIVDLPPFLDAGAWPRAARRAQGPALRLLAVGMMREGDKLASYRLLAASLDLCRDLDWHLAIAGDGPAAPAVREAFAPFGARVSILGRLDGGETLAAAYGEADLFVWPAVNEAYGMVFLEAQLQGTPVLAGNEGGVASVVADGLTGRLAPPRDPAAFAASLRALAADRAGLGTMGAAARARVLARHDLPVAAATLSAALLPLLEAAP